MRRAARLFLLCLLCLSLPLQALAAAQMGMSMVVADGGQPGVQQLDCHGASLAHGAPADSGDEHAPQPAGQHKSCGACCLLSLSGMPALPRVPALPPASHARPAPELAPAGFLPEGLERPPRQFS
jgi:hypothetical protein